MDALKIAGPIDDDNVRRQQIEKEIFKKTLKRLGLNLENRLSNKVGLLSGGQRQALTLLMATLQKPKLLLLDEHTAALDPKTAKAVLDVPPLPKIKTFLSFNVMLLRSISDFNP